jgi:hypothetical protein
VTTGSRDDPTYVGQVASVQGGVVRVRLRETPSTLVLVDGESYRIGQIGAFLRVPLGYTQLYGVCTQVGADAAPMPKSDVHVTTLVADEVQQLEGFRWLTIALFGESVGGRFDRGVGQYPTVGDAVHLVTPADLETIYGTEQRRDAVTIGRIAGSTGISAQLQLSSLVSRHASVVGSTGAGKSNFVAVLLEALTDGEFPTARILVIDPHGEYAAAVGRRGSLISTGQGGTGTRLRVPYWALPFDELIDMTMGPMQPGTREGIRDRVRDMKLAASAHLADPPPAETVTADSPIPFSIRRLWFDLADDEAVTFDQSNKQDATTRLDAVEVGDAATLRPPQYPPPTSLNTPPYPNRSRRNIGRQLDLLRGRLLDTRFSFMFDPDDPLHPDLEGRTEADLDSTLAQWVGGDLPVTVLDVSGVPQEVIGSVVGTMLRLIYDALFWAMDLPVGGRSQPLLVVIDEAHRFLPEGDETPAHRTVSRIAKEGRKYGVGLLVVTQRPADVHAGVLSQCGTMIALRVTNPDDRRAVAGTVPDDLGGLISLLPSLRTGEALVLGDALQVPSRVRVRRARSKPVGDDPPLPAAWQRDARPDPALYREAVRNWRAGSTSADVAEQQKEDT